MWEENRVFCGSVSSGVKNLKDEKNFWINFWCFVLLFFSFSD